MEEAYLSIEQSLSLSRSNYGIDLACSRFVRPSALLAGAEFGPLAMQPERRIGREQGGPREERHKAKVEMRGRPRRLVGSRVGRSLP